MSIRVIIERQTIPGNEIELNRLLMELRIKAMQSKGYISGQTLRALDDPNHFVVISTWDSLENWKRWEASTERKEIQQKIDTLLRSPASHRVYVHY